MPPRTQARLAHPRHTVTAVLVCHDGAPWLSETLAGLQQQRRPAQRVVAVDTGSSDDSVAQLSAELGAEAVLAADRTAGFGAAVQHALDAFAGAPDLRAGREEPVHWVWLLHDDSAPAPDALARLLAAAEDSPSAAVLGAKAVDWDDPRLLREVGFTTDPGGHRETGLEAGEHDQGQHDGVRDVLAVGSAGMLVRRDVWDALGGFDRALPLFRDDLDLCWRARAAGHRVVVVPDAVVRHAEAASSGRRAVHAGPSRVRRAERHHAMFVLLAHARAAALPLVATRLVLGCLLRSLGLLLGKRLGDALDELVALGSLLARPRALVLARRSRAATRVEPASAVKPLLGRRGARVRHVADLGARRVSRWAAQLGVDQDTTPRAVESGPSEFDDEYLRGSGVLRRLLVQPPVVLVLTMTGLALLADRRLLQHGMLVGGALLPTPAGASDLWHGYTASWHAIGPGTAAASAPWLAVLAGLATLLLGKAGAAVGLLMLFGVPLAALSAYASGARVARQRWLRAWLAASYALLPALLGATAAGRIGTVLAHVLLPPLALVVWKALGGSGEAERWRLVAGAVLLATVVVAAAPVLWPLLLVAVLVSLALGRTALAPTVTPRPLLRLAAAPALALGPVVLLLPWSLDMLLHPARALMGPGLDPAGLADPALDPWRLLAAWPGGPGMPPVFLLAPVVVAAAVGLVRADGAALARAGWGLVLTGLGLAIVVSRAELPVAAGAATAAWPGPLTSAIGLGLCLAAGVAARGGRTALRTMAFSWRQPAAAFLVLAAALSTLGLALGWVASGAGDPVHRERRDLRPAFVAAEAQGPQAARTLVLRSAADSAAISYELMRGTPVDITGAGSRPTARQRAHLDAVVQDLAAGRGNQPAERLATYAVRYVALPAPGDPALAAALDGTTGLSPISVEGRTRLWRVVAPTGRVVVLDGAARATAEAGEPPTTSLLLQHPPTVLTGVSRVTAPAGGDSRLLVLAEARDGGWRAELGGVRLKPRTAWGWAQAWELPAAGGDVSISHHDPDRQRWLILQGTLVALTVLAAAPSARRRTRSELGGAA